MYNLKVSSYLDSTEVCFYSVPIHGNKRESDSLIIERGNETIQIPSYLVFDSESSSIDIEDKMLHSFFTSFNRTKNKIYNYARANKWEWFLTFTFNPEYVDSFDYEEITNCMTDFLHRMLWVNRDNHFQYLIVPEQHKSGRWHLHGVFSNIDMRDWKFTFSGKFTKGGSPIWNVGAFPWGFTTATAVSNTKAVSHYIVKYITKDMMDRLEHKKRYWVSYNLSLGQHETYFISQSELQTILDSFGEVEHCKSVSTPYNDIRYYQF